MFSAMFNLRHKNTAKLKCVKHPIPRFYIGMNHTFFILGDFPGVIYRHFIATGFRINIRIVRIQIQSFKLTRDLALVLVDIKNL